MITLVNMHRSTASNIMNLLVKKVCKVCGDEKELKRFKKSGTMKDGRENKCLDCYAADKSRSKGSKAAYKKEFFDFDEPAF